MDFRVRNIPEKLWQRVKVSAALKSVTLTKWMFEAIKEKLEREEKAASA